MIHILNNHFTLQKKRKIITEIKSRNYLIKTSFVCEGECWPLHHGQCISETCSENLSNEMFSQASDSLKQWTEVPERTVKATAVILCCDIKPPTYRGRKTIMRNLPLILQPDQWIKDDLLELVVTTNCRKPKYTSKFSWRTGNWDTKRQE